MNNFILEYDAKIKVLEKEIDKYIKQKGIKLAKKNRC